jgi:hypothetical protein
MGHRAAAVVRLPAAVVPLRLRWCRCCRFGVAMGPRGRVRATGSSAIVGA